MSSDVQQVVVVGQGYVGLPLALAAVDAGYAVVGLDVAKTVVDGLADGVSHVDDVSDADVAAALQLGYRVTIDASVIGEADVVIVCVPTPLDATGGPDLAPLLGAVDDIVEHVQPGTLCLIESTTYPGTTEDVLAPLILRDAWAAGKDIFIAYSPERVDPGNQRFGLRNTPKVVGGLTPECTRRAALFYERFVDRVVTVPRAREAEMAKLIENTFRHVNIALVNEMVRFSEDLDIDLWAALEAAETKPFGYMPFRPGPGVGGHCIPVDPLYLSHRVRSKLGYPFRMVEVAEEINQSAPYYVANRASRLLNRQQLSVNGARVLLLGVAYKADISDVRESPANLIESRLGSWGAEIRYHDPYVQQWTNPANGRTHHCVPDLADAIREADIVVLLQSHARYMTEDLGRFGTPVLDTRGKLRRGPNVHRL